MKTACFDITGMSCAACSARIEKTVRALPGIQKAGVNLLANSMAAEYDEAVLSAGDIAAAVDGAGYGAVLRDAGGKRAPAASSAPGRGGAAGQALAAMKRRLALSFAFLLPLMYVSMGHMVHLPLPAFLRGAENGVSFALTQLLLTLPIVLANHRYFTGGFGALARRAPNMDSLIALGASASLAYGVFALYRIGWGLGHGQPQVAAHYMHELYFESAAMILALITLGKTLETLSKGRTGAAIAALLDLAPKTALLLENGAEREVPVEQVAAGDTLAVKPGARVPVDGVLLSGHGAVDESAVTGESLPVDKAEGDALTGATVNTTGYFTMRATRVGSDTTLAQIVALVEEAGASKAPIARLADKVSGVFVPIVIGIALACFAFWLLAGSGVEFALARAVTVLVISCPCALGLATPVAIMTGTGRGAKSGILYRSAEALEALASVDTFVLDKTGTVTLGRPQMTDLIPCGIGEEDLLALAAGMEQKSEHPMALAVLAAAKQRGVTPASTEAFDSLPGLGIYAKIDGAHCYAGNARFMAQQGVGLEAAGRLPQSLAAQGKTPLYFSRAGRLAGVIALADLPKAGSAAAIAAMRRHGLRAVMLTGDNAATAEAVRAVVGLDEAVAEVLPQDKDKHIQSLMAQGRKVAMVGDGINDAPALARADVGIAIGAGADVAIESAGIVLMKSELGDAVTARELSRAVLRNIRQNLFWAFFYNIIGIPVAAGALYPAFGLTLSPMLGAAAMSLSSLFVVANALRLNLFRPAAPLPARAGGGPHALPGAPQGRTHTKEDTTMERTLHIEGMSCGHCSGRVRQALNALPGVRAEVSHETGIATVTADAAVPDEQLKQAVTDAGYTVTALS